jgi:protein-tyrosine-phosphatase
VSSERTKVLFVCQHNVARSKVAELICTRLFPGIEFSSAGMAPEAKFHSIPEPINTFLRSNWEDPVRSFGKNIKEEDLSTFSLILVSNHSYAKLLELEYPSSVRCLCNECRLETSMVSEFRSLTKSIEYAVGQFVFAATRLLLREGDMIDFRGADCVITPLSFRSYSVFSHQIALTMEANPTARFLELDMGQRGNLRPIPDLDEDLEKPSDIYMKTAPLESLYPMDELFETMQTMNAKGVYIVGLNSPCVPLTEKIDLAAMVRMSMGRESILTP